MSDQGYGPGGGNYGDPQYPSDPQGGQYGSQYGNQYGGQYGNDYGNDYGDATGRHGAPSGGSSQRGIFIGLGAVVVAGLVVLVLAVTGVFSSSSTATGSPKDAVEKVLFASKKQNLDDVKAGVCAKDLTNPELSDIVGSEHAESYSIGSVTEQGDDRAVVDVRVTTSEETTSSKLAVLKENGTWKVCFSDSRGSSITDTAPPPSTDTTPPTDPPTTPVSSPPTTSSTSLFCGTQTVASDVAKTFISFITLSSTSLADDCVYQGRISSAQLEALTGDIYSPTQNDGQPGPKFVYKSAQGESTITLTVEKEPDGKYYVTAASKS